MLILSDAKPFVQWEKLEHTMVTHFGGFIFFRQPKEAAAGWISGCRSMPGRHG
jgi:hypothetical protein